VSEDRLAGARRWLEVVERALAADEAESAIGAARTGLNELGPDSASEGVDAADELIAAGDTEGGARMLADLLRERIGRYGERHADTIEP
jgi:hypothetical protein